LNGEGELFLTTHIPYKIFTKNQLNTVMQLSQICIKGEHTMSFTAKDVALLREKTGAGMMDCKKALTEVNGDMKKAEEFLREQGVAVAAKKASRVASEGAVWASVAKDGKAGALVEINCESDFVAKSPDFQELCSEIADIVSASNPKDNDALLSLKGKSKLTVQELLNTATAKIGEKMSLRHFVRYESKGYIGSYIHLGGKIGILVEYETNKDLSKNKEFTALANDIAMHIAAFNPQYVDSTSIPKEFEASELEILRNQAMNDPKSQGKPEQVIEGMVKGRYKKQLAEICLVEQPFVRGMTESVSVVLDKIAKAEKAEIKIIRFERLVMGEGLEKKTDNLAEEVAKLSK